MMGGSRLSVKASPHSMDFLMDTGNPTLNCTLDGVLKIGGVGAAHAATQEAYSLIRKGTEAYRPMSQIHPMPVARTSRSIIVEQVSEFMSIEVMVNANLDRVWKNGLGQLRMRSRAILSKFLTILGVYTGIPGFELHMECMPRGLFNVGHEMPSARRDIEKIVMKAGKEGLQWGMVAGMYAGFEYGIEKARGGKQDWKNAAVGGALTGVILSVSDGRVSQDKMVRTALTASALATAADFLKLF